MWSLKHQTLPEGARQPLNASLLALGISVVIQICTVGFFTIGWSIFALIYGGNEGEQIFLFFLLLIALFVVLPISTIIFLYRVKAKKRFFIIGSVFLTVAATPSILLFFGLQDSDMSGFRTATMIVIVSWLITIGLSAFAWYKVRLAER